MDGYPLELSPDDVEQFGSVSMACVNGFFDNLGHAHAAPLGDARNRHFGDEFAPREQGHDFRSTLDAVVSAAREAVETAGPKYMAFIPGGGLFTSALGEFLARCLNRYTATAETAPALNAIESSVIRWLSAEFGMPESGGGNLTTGGSMATLSALVAARFARLGNEFARGTMYVTEYTNHCVQKSARIVGFPSSAIRRVPVAPDFRMDPAAAERMIHADRDAGARPFLLVATAGTTAAGTVDDLTALADLAQREGMWLHVDAAYGGFFQLTGRGRQVLRGIELADSIVLDPHKGMFLPYGTGSLLVRDVSVLLESHSDPEGAPSYFENLVGTETPDYADLGIERTREYRGLRVWLPLWLHGIAAFRSALEEKLTLTRMAYDQLRAEPTLVCDIEPTLSTVVFRLRQGGDEANQQLLRGINDSGEVRCSSVRMGGAYMIRLCILSFRTHEEHVSAAIRVVREQARTLTS